MRANATLTEQAEALLKEIEHFNRGLLRNFVPACSS